MSQKIENPMRQLIAVAPTSFDGAAFADRWFHWSDVSQCFWPGKGRRAACVNPELAAVRYLSGVYCVAWSEKPPLVVGPTAVEIRYIGQSGEFRRRMGQFGNSAGFWGPRKDGHSAAFRWPFGLSAYAWIGFFPFNDAVLPHLAEGLRHWREALALEEYRLRHNRLPEVNEAVTELNAFET
jgi:hypothetical protein